MNKRQKNKNIKNKNNARLDKILSRISKTYTITDIIHRGGYFIFDFGKNAICYFKVKEIPNWVWCIWLLEDDTYKIFGDYEDFIDKFKPSRTYVSNDNVDDFLDKINLIYNNQKLYIIDALTGIALIDYCEDDGYTHGYQVSSYYDNETKQWIYTRNKSITQEDFVNKEYDNLIKEDIKEQEDDDFDRLFALDYFKKIPKIFDGVRAVGIKNIKPSIIHNDYILTLIVEKYVTDEDVKSIVNEISKVNKSKDRKTNKYKFYVKSVFDLNKPDTKRTRKDTLRYIKCDRFFY